MKKKYGYTFLQVFLFRMFRISHENEHKKKLLST